MYKIPDKLYFKFKSLGGGTVQSYMTAYEPDKKAFANWRNNFVYDKNDHMKDAEEVKDNIPTEGFKILRPSYKGWLIHDPRGFELEISEQNFCEMLNSCSVISGVIQDKCIWSLKGSSNWLIIENSKAAKSVKRLAETVALKGVQRGDTVLDKQNRKMKYLGYVFCLYYESGYYSYNKLNQRVLDVSKMYAVLHEGSNRVEFLRSVKFSQILKKTEEPMSAIDVSRFLNDNIQNDKGHWSKPLLVNHVKFKASDITWQKKAIEDATLVKMKANLNSKNSPLMFAEHEKFGTVLFRYWTSKSPSAAEVAVVSLNTKDEILYTSHTRYEALRHSYNSGTRQVSIMETIDKEDFLHIDWYCLSMSLDNQNHYTLWNT